MIEYFKEYGYILAIFLALVLIGDLLLRELLGTNKRHRARITTERWWALLSKEQKMFEVEQIGTDLTFDELNKVREAKGYVEKPLTADEL